MCGNVALVQEMAGPQSTPVAPASVPIEGKRHTGEIEGGVSQLGAWLDVAPLLLSKKECCFKLFVPRVRLEPTLPYGKWILSRKRTSPSVSTGFLSGQGTRFWRCTGSGISRSDPRFEKIPSTVHI